MSAIVVVGGGIGGIATAARLAKIGHQVTLLEARDRIGGALGSVHEETDAGVFSWDTGPTHTRLPAVLRDLFRKSGRTLDRELDLVPLSPMRRHVFADGTELDLPGGSRAEQKAAVTGALGAASAEQWNRYVDGLAEPWELLRREFFERPYDPDHLSRPARDLLGSRQSMQRHLARVFKDERLREVAGDLVALDGHSLRDVPWWWGVWTYVEQNFGLWTVPGGMGRLVEVLEQRLATRGVTVLTGTAATDLVVADGRAVGVRTDAGVHDADRVVVGVDPRRLPALAGHVQRTMPAIPPVMAHLGLVGDVPDLPAEVVLHGDPQLVLRTGGTAPNGAHAWTVLGRGRLSEDIVTALYRKGIKIRDQVEVRLDWSPRELVEEWGGSPLGVLWQGRGSVHRRLGPTTPITGVYQVGAHAKTGSGLAPAGLSAAQVATLIGPA